jgi:molybdate transport system regulatory protein
MMSNYRTRIFLGQQLSIAIKAAATLQHRKRERELALRHVPPHNRPMGRETSKRAPSAKAAGKTSLHLRIDFGGTRSIGPGKIRLLELILKTGSISAAGRALAMSYRQAWLLVDELNRMFREPVVIAQTGGGGGGGTVVTETGHDIIRLYRGMERHACGASTAERRALARLLARPASTRERNLT